VDRQEEGELIMDTTAAVIGAVKLEGVKAGDLLVLKNVPDISFNNARRQLRQFTAAALPDGGEFAMILLRRGQDFDYIPRAELLAGIEYAMRGPAQIDADEICEGLLEYLQSRGHQIGLTDQARFVQHQKLLEAQDNGSKRVGGGGSTQFQVEGLSRYKKESGERMVSSCSEKRGLQSSESGDVHEVGGAWGQLDWPGAEKHS
jgi:hypothetical protein